MKVWRPPPQQLKLADDEVHVWRVALDTLPARYTHPRDVLTDDERTRIAQWRFVRDRQRRGAGRAWLREILGRYLCCDPRHVRFRYNAYGRPALAAGYGAAAPCFNMTYADGVALYGIARGVALGIDLARMVEQLEFEPVAEYCFSAAELRQLWALPASQRRAGFFACWTRKEAYIKARGLGMSLDLKCFDVVVAPDGPVELLCTREPGQHAGSWTLRAIDVGTGYAAAVAVGGPCVRIELWDPCQAASQGIPGFAAVR